MTPDRLKRYQGKKIAIYRTWYNRKDIKNEREGGGGGDNALYKVKNLKRLRKTPCLLQSSIRCESCDPKRRCPDQYASSYAIYRQGRIRVVITGHSVSTALLGDGSISGLLSLLLADCGDPELSRLSSPGLTRIFHLAVFLTSSLTLGGVPCNLPAISLAFCSPSLLVRRELERLGSSGLARASLGRSRVGLSAADTGIEG